MKAIGLEDVITELENLKKCYLGEEDAVMKPVSFGEYIQEIIEATRSLSEKGIYIPVKVGDTVYTPFNRSRSVLRKIFRLTESSRQLLRATTANPERTAVCYVFST